MELRFHYVSIFTFINTKNSPWVITVETNIKIGNNYEKNLIRNGHFIRIITDGSGYFIDGFGDFSSDSFHFEMNSSVFEFRFFRFFTVATLNFSLCLKLFDICRSLLYRLKAGIISILVIIII